MLNFRLFLVTGFEPFAILLLCLTLMYLLTLK